MAVDQEPARQRRQPAVLGAPGRDRGDRDHEGEVGRHVHVRHPVGAEHRRVQRAEQGDHGQRGGGAADRPGPAVADRHHRGGEQRVQPVEGDQLAVPRRRDQVQRVVEERLAPGLNVEERGPRVVEVLPRVVADQQREPPGLLDQDRVGPHVGVLVLRGAEQERVPDQEHDQHQRERDGPGDRGGRDPENARPPRAVIRPRMMIRVALITVSDRHSPTLTPGCGWNHKRAVVTRGRLAGLPS